MQQAIGCRWNVQQQLAVPPDGCEVELDEIVDRSNTVVFGWVIEPPRPNRNVDFRRAPHSAVAIPVLQRVDDAWTVDSRIWNARRIHHPPIRITGRSLFVAAPPHVGSGI